MQRHPSSASSPQIDSVDRGADRNFSHLRGPVCAAGLVAFAGVVDLAAHYGVFSRPFQNHSHVTTAVDTYRIDLFGVDSDGTIIAHVPRFQKKDSNLTGLHIFRNNKWNELPMLPAHMEVVDFAFRPDTHAPLAFLHSATTSGEFLNQIFELTNDEWRLSRSVGGFYGENLLRAGEFLIMRGSTDVGVRSALSVLHKGSWATIDVAPFRIEKLSCAVAWNGGFVVGGDIRDIRGEDVGVLFIRGSEVTALGGGFSFSEDNRSLSPRMPDVCSLVLMNGEVYAIGNFTGTGSTSFSFAPLLTHCQRIARFDGTHWVPFSTAIVERPKSSGLTSFQRPTYQVLGGHDRIVVVVVPPYALQIGEHTGAGIFECFADGSVRYSVVLDSGIANRQTAVATPEGEVFFKQEPVSGRDRNSDVQIRKLLQK